MRHFIFFKTTLLLIFVLAIIFVSCSKDDISDYSQVTTEENIANDPVVENFLNRSYLSSVNENINGLESRDYDERIDRVIDYLNKQNTKRNFIRKLSKEYGYPIWDKSYINPLVSNDDILITPLAFEDGKNITSFFIAFASKDSYHVELFTKKNIDSLIKSANRKNKALILSVLYSINADFEIFNHKNKEYNEWYSKVSSDLTNEDVAETRECVAYTICVPLVALQGDNDRAETRNDVYCYTYYVCENEDVNSGGSCQNCGNGGGSGNPGGGSSGSSTQTLEEMFFDQFKYKTIDFGNSTDAQRISHILRVFKVACQVPGINKIELKNFFTNINTYTYTAHANISGQIVALDWATSYTEVSKNAIIASGGYVPSINGLNDPNGGTVRFRFNRFSYGGGNFPALEFVINSKEESTFKQKYLPCY